MHIPLSLAITGSTVRHHWATSQGGAIPAFQLHSRRTVGPTALPLQEVFVSAEYDKKGNKGLIACSYPKLAEDVSPGCQILCADGSLVLEVQECLPAKKCVRCKALNTAAIGCAALSPAP